MRGLQSLSELPLLVILMGIGSVGMMMPAAHAVAMGHFGVARGFFYSSIVVLVLTAMIAIATASYRGRASAQGQLLSVIGVYLVLPVLFAFPMQQATTGVSFGDAWFEMLSAFTTTGATVFDTPGAIAPSVHFWRAMVGWLGGFYSLLITASVLVPIGLGGVELMGGRVPGKAGGGGQITRIAEPSQRIAHYTALMFPVYVGLTLILWVALLVAGDSALIALCHAMGTLSSSGISPLVGLGGTASGLTGEMLIFMFMAFALTRRLWPGAVMVDRSLKPWQDPELRLAVGIVAAVTAVLSFYHAVLIYNGVGVETVFVTLRAIWGTAFTTLSFLTTTGFQSGTLPDLGSAGLVFLGLAIIGGGVATTAGGVKLLRVYALLRHGERELERVVHPHSIGGHGPVARRLRRQGAYLAWIFFMMFGVSIGGITAALTLAGLGVEDALLLGVAALSNTGQLATIIGDAPISYASLEAVPKALLGSAMILGRLEILAIFVVFSRESWAR